MGRASFPNSFLLVKQWEGRGVGFLETRLPFVIPSSVTEFVFSTLQPQRLPVTGPKVTRLPSASALVPTQRAECLRFFPSASPQCLHVTSWGRSPFRNLLVGCTGQCQVYRRSSQVYAPGGKCRHPCDVILCDVILWNRHVTVPWTGAAACGGLRMPQFGCRLLLLPFAPSSCSPSSPSGVHFPICYQKWEM